MTGVFKKLLLIVLGTAAGLLAVELALRAGLPVGAYLPDQLNAMDASSLGAKAAGASRIVVIGDSMAAYSSAWPSQLESLLPRTQVVNLAVVGTGPDSYRNILKLRGLPLHPDWVVVMVYVGNDLRDVLEWQRRPAWRRALRDLLRAHSYLAWFIRENWSRKLKWRLRSRRSALWGNALVRDGARRGISSAELDRRIAKIPARWKPGNGKLTSPYLIRVAVLDPQRFEKDLSLSNPAIAGAMDQSERFLTEMRDAVARRGGRLAIVVAPACVQIRNGCAGFYRSIGFEVPPDARELDAPNRRLMAWAAASSVPALDLRLSLEKAGSAPIYIEGDDHWNAKGQDVVAAAVADFLKPLLGH